MGPMDLLALARAFATDGVPEVVEPLGNGNVNATYLVRTSSGCRYVLQRLNTAVFAQPELVMANLERLATHAAAARSDGSLWQLPTLVHLQGRDGEGSPADTLLRADDHEAWRMLTFVAGAHSLEVVSQDAEAFEVGRGLGCFHALIHDLPAHQLADTLEGFHITPRYHARYLALIAAAADGSPAAERLQDPRAQWCQSFVATREVLVPVLEEAKAAGRLQLRPIHGDPKVNNVMLCSRSGCAVAMVDLDTVKPGLLHYDIGDALRSGCNRAGEETTEFDAVRFDLDLAAAMLRGYLSEAGAVLSPHDVEHLYDAIRLLPFELGLRFFTDDLEGDVYFKVTRPRHNLERALVQFRLTESIEAQEAEIRALIHELCGL